MGKKKLFFAKKRSVIPTSNIISYYKFDNNVNDSAGGNNGTPTNISYVTGKVNNACDFNGSSSMVIVPNSGDFTFNNGVNDLAFTISFWINADYLTSNPRIIDIGNPFNTNNRVIRFISVNSIMYVVLYDENSNTNSFHSTYNTTLPLSSWHFVSFSYDGSGNTTGLQFKINNIENTSYSENGLFNNLASTNYPITISRDAALNGNFFNGSLDELVFWNRVLTDVEETAIFNKGLNGQELL